MTDVDFDRYPFLRKASLSDVGDLWPDDDAALLAEVGADLYRDGLNENEVHQLEGLMERL